MSVMSESSLVRAMIFIIAGLLKRCVRKVMGGQVFREEADDNHVGSFHGDDDSGQKSFAMIEEDQESDSGHIASRTSSSDSMAETSCLDLPQDLTAAVLQCLPPHHLDRVRFGSVCTQWRAAALDNPALPPNFPWLALPDRSFYSLPRSAFGLLPLPVHLDGHGELPHAQSSCGEWLVFQRRDDGALTLMSPFSAATIVLPGLHTLQHPNKKPFIDDVQVRKLVVCSDKLVAAVIAEETAGPFPTVGLALCRPGGATWSWAIVPGINMVLKVQDIIMYQGQLYALSFSQGRYSVLVQEDIAGQPTLSQVDKVINALSSRKTLFMPPDLPNFYLLESGGKLLMVNQHSVRTPPTASIFLVYVAMFQHSQWLMPTTRSTLEEEAVPDNVVLFLGPWCSRSVAIPEQDQGKSYIVKGGRSIIFFSSDDDDDGGATNYYRKRVTFDCSVYDIMTGRSQSLLHMSLWKSKGSAATTWVFPPMN